MYIRYERSQRETQSSKRYIAFDNEKYGSIAPIRLTDVPVPQFKPTWLLRVSDMERVPGSSVTEHYWALSYSWNQSGELIHKGGEEYDRVDEGRHLIIEEHKILWWWRSKKKVEVKFEELIQQICNDAGIQYIWYDQVCIDQDNHDKKMFEIKRMHLIYANAFSTLALVPELYRMNDSSNPGKALDSLEILRSQWCTRIWTLEEAYMSRNILFVGRDAYLWCDDNDVSQYHGTAALFLKNIQHGYKKQKWKACTALWYARTRTSSKAHDRIFALLNIFPELKDKVPFNYQQPVLDLMISFYGLLAKEDPSILAFGLPSKYLVEFEKFTITQKETSMLPSWTGANGVHVPQACFKYETSTESYCCNVTGECISLTSEFIFAHVGIAETVECDEPYFERRRQGKYGCAKDGIPFQFLARRFGITAPKTNHLTFATTTPKSQEIHSDHTLHCGLYATHFLPLIEENWAAVNTLSNPTCIGGVLSLTENTSECIILTGLEFKISTTSYNSVEDGYYRCYPVITKYKGHYKSIGLCFFDRDRGFYSTVIQPRQTFCIR